MSPHPPATAWRIGIDVGGTFTDLVAVPGAGEVWRLDEAVTHKVASTPHDPSEGVERGLVELLGRGVPAESVAAITHGTTIGLNAILQGRVAGAALVTSAGHRDVLQIARARMPRSFDLHARPAPPLIPRSRVFELDRRYGSSGDPVPAADDDLEALAARLAEARAEVVVVSLIGGYAARADEQGVARRLGEILGLPVRSAAALWPQAGEYERVTLALLDAQITPLMTRYFTSLQARLSGLRIDVPLYISTSNGGSVSLEAAMDQPIQTVLSGPASGVSAAAATWPERDLVTFDMGGTSSDIGVLHAGAPMLTTAATVGPHPLIMPVVEVSAIGAGGGSVVWADDVGAEPVLRVGPESVGAVPGPASYGAGGDRPALTDAYVHAGVIDPDRFLDGTFPLRSDLATAALARVAGDLAQTDAEAGAPEPSDARAAADGVVDASFRIASVGMAARLRRVLAARGEVPERYLLVAFGGAGATHAALLAEEVGIGGVLVPSAAGTFCALGAAIAPIRRDWARTLRVAVDERSRGELEDACAALREEADAWLRQEQPDARAVLVFTADLHYDGQFTSIEIPLGESSDAGAAPEVDAGDVVRRFADRHEQLYGFADATAGVRTSTVRASMTVQLGEARHGAGSELFREVGRRSVRYDGQRRDAAVYALATDGEDAWIDGPAVIDRPDTTVLVPQGWRATGEAAGIRLDRVTEGARADGEDAC
ncbi:hydantoinase/oxoprolinase family protein [Microbacterium marinilacus]|uniref:Hydantoinase/oxoprolinase family protein n=1 Tax=Microbacterium marinilacus TaxID=415209 RepID=A0ABP7BKN5_9MICO|nr:hydantoinase/oxoprolinase family protein [Microbacterium marinilacus]MBY0689717.1 hydantoinase/oxoprolinase family protein [Microbacterium marinilacus]